MTAMWIIYLADVSGSLQIFLGLIGGIVGFVLFMFSALCEWKFDEMKKFKAGTMLAGALIATLISVLMPDKQTIYMMAAAKVGQDIVQAPETKEIGDKVLKLINQKLDDQLGGGK
jgi:hypothetical protein